MADVEVNQRKLISFVSPCYNEEGNVDELYNRIVAVWQQLPEYDFELIIIDNASVDSTVLRLKALAKMDSRLKIIVNTRNFGHIRSPYWGMLQARGDAIVYLASDLQDPPEHTLEFIRQWEKCYKIVLGVKPVSQENRLFSSMRKFYYRTLNRISDISLINNATGFGIYDRIVIEHVRHIADPYPYFRGLICELGYDIKTIEFEQPRRSRGFSKNNIYTLYDIAMLGVVSHSRVPIRLAAALGFFTGLGSIVIAIVYLILKLIYWHSFPMGIAPLVIGMFFMFGIILAFIGLLGEYIGSIHTYLQNRPVVVEKERINF